MGVDAGDFDNDGDEDLYITHLPAEGNNLYVNDGNGALRGSQRAVRARPAEPRLQRLRHRVVRLRQRRLARHLLAVNGAIEAIKGRAEGAAVSLR